MSGSDEFFRFPHTPHLIWLGDAPPRQDKVLEPSEAARFFRTDVSIEEKVDGTNLGFSVAEGTELRIQRRGSYVHATDHPQFAPLRRWLGTHRAGLIEALSPDLVLFGEWCVAIHTIEYDALPDWFLAFDVYERSSGRFWSAARRDAFCAGLGISTVPTIARGRFDERGMRALLGPSKLGAPKAEGIYVRIEDGEHLVARAKIVRPEFQQSLGEHWSARMVRRNRLTR